MILAWLRRRRRERLLATPFPAQWLAILEHNVPYYGFLDRAEQAALRDSLRVFVAEKYWEGCAGLAVTDEMKVTVAAQACLLTLGLDGDPWRGVESILIYPNRYLAPQEPRYLGTADLSIVDETPRAMMGQARYRGPVVLSWEDVLADAREPGCGENLVWHEFAHQLDMLDRSTNGTPPLADPAQRRRWHDVMTAEYEQLVEDAREGRETLLDPYGTQNEAEFFAVTTECFFDRPVELRREHPKLYDLLAEYYRQDPASRMPQ